MRRLDQFIQTVNIRLNQIDGKVFDLMRQTTLLMKNKPKEQGSTANSRPDKDYIISHRTQPSDHGDFLTPDKFKTVVSHYVTEQSDGVNEGAHQPSTTNFQYELAINGLKKDLMKKEEDYIKSLQEIELFKIENRRLKEEIDHLNN